jgi:hypothetical protein
VFPDAPQEELLRLGHKLQKTYKQLILGAFSTGIFQAPMHYPALTFAMVVVSARTNKSHHHHWRRRVERIEHHDR